MEPGRKSECAAGKPGTDLTKVSQVRTSVSICSVHNYYLTKNPKYGPYKCHPCARDPYMSMDKTVKAGREAQAVRDAKQEQDFVIKPSLNLTEAGIPSAL